MTATKTYALAGSTMTILVGGAETGNRFALLLVAKPAGSSTPPHSHDAETELVYPLLGRVGVETEGRVRDYPAGETVILPPGRPHRLFNDSGATAREFLLCAPAIFDRFVATAGVEIAPGSIPVPMTDEDRNRLIEAAPNFGVRLLPSANPVDAPCDVPAAPIEFIDMLGSRIEVIARLGSGDDDLVLLRTVFLPESSVPFHSHFDPECLCVISGMLDVYRDDEGWTTLHAEQAAYVASGVRHAIRNSGNAPAAFLMLTTTHMARFLATIGSPATDGEPHPPGPAELASFHRRIAEYGYWFGSPVENEVIGL